MVVIAGYEYIDNHLALHHLLHSLNSLPLHLNAHLKSSCIIHSPHILRGLVDSYCTLFRLHS